jgi:hypothetical protein
LIAGGGMLLLPDTPRWYYARGRYAEGDAVLCRLHDAPLDDPAVQNMKQGILASIKLEEVKENGFQLLDLIWDRSDLRSGRRIRISFMILSLQQMMGLFNLLNIFKLVLLTLLLRNQPFSLLFNSDFFSSRVITFFISTLSGYHEYSFCSRNNSVSFHD